MLVSAGFVPDPSSLSSGKCPSGSAPGTQGAGRAGLLSTPLAPHCFSPSPLAAPHAFPRLASSPTPLPSDPQLLDQGCLCSQSICWGAPFPGPRHPRVLSPVLGREARGMTKLSWVASPWRPR